MSEKVFTAGNVMVNDIKVGDIHYEYDMGLGVKCEVLTKPTLNDEDNWIWVSKNLKTNKEINYLINPKYSHYGPKLYDYEAYKVKLYT